MTVLPEAVAGLVKLSGGKVVGKTRLQKVAYLLCAKDLWPTELTFSYHYYGPFSHELSYGVDDAVALNLVSTEERRGSHKEPYVIFSVQPTTPDFPENKHREEVQKVLATLSKYSAVELELAATAHFLSDVERVEDCWSEVHARKGDKATPQREANAKRLLEELHLAPEA
jgi:uncharacterized protein